ncbi:PPE family protein [Mycobacterium conspicuum]|jgi:PPE-repeat protein|uniref:Putative PPE family protein PPE38 n=1 Tax=Mycobacterium conspicuum TaxID=44010 RepID=A0A1X1T2S3_9MYCO|nr:PPE family protein [Mycobacterium conspicuum]ORV38576.1 hypothetical protein AWC00_19585 [Mycobacterium conspicuum]BBZ41101.1 putative PPE family protein PPE38 [Mycobacterium conspicuum]
MDFLVLPPEINSTRMHGGAGSEPLLTAAAAWRSLATDLYASAAAFRAVLSALTDGVWSGPAALAMAGAAAPYEGWLSASAAQAEEAAAQARSAATAFETARAATVHPAAVAANRVQLIALVATNFLGQNTPAIAATEFDYAEMWAQDVAAMVAYHAGAMSVASTLTPFGTPPIKLVGSAFRATAAASDPPPADPPPMTPPTMPSLPTLQSLLQALTSGVQGLASPVGTAISPLMMLMSAAMQGSTQSAALTNAAGAVPAAALSVGGALPDVKALGGAAGLGGVGVSAGLGQGRLVGALSVPADWAGSMPARSASAAMSGLAAMPDTAPTTAAPGLGGMPMPMPMGGAGAGGAMMGRGGASPHVVQNRPSVVPRAGVG